MTQHLGKYQLRRKLGAGGMGEVWEALDTVLDRPVAVKLLADDPDARQSVREAAAAARVNHPNAVVVYDAAECDGRWVIVMELVNGPSVAKLVGERGPLPWEEATRIARDAAAGLAAVHAAGLVHRDVKPANILLTPEGVAKVADFGLARTSSSTTVTALVGTPHYMSPEQCWNETADGRADVYSLGATYYTLLTALPPFSGDTEMAVMYAHCHSPVPDPRAAVPDLPTGCVAVVRRAMAKTPAERFASAEDLRAALDALLAGARPPTRDLPTESIRLPPNTVARPAVPRPFPTRRVAIVGGVGAVAAAGLVAFAVWPRPPVTVSPPTSTPGDPPTDEPDWSGPWEVGGAVQQIVISPDGRRIAVGVDVGDGKGELHLRTRDGHSVADWPKPAAGVEGVAFSPDGRLLASASRGWQKVQVVDVATGREQQVEDGDVVPGASAVAFSPDGTRLAVGGYTELGAVIRFWEWEESGRWRKLRETTALEYQVWGFAFAPGRNLLTVGLGVGADDDKRAAVRLFDASTGKEVHWPGVKPTRESIGPPLAFAAAAPVMVLGSVGAVHRLRVPDWGPLGPPLVLELNEAKAEAWALAVSPDGSVVAGGRDVDIHLWRAEDGATVRWAVRHTGTVHALSFTPDGRWLLSGGADGKVLIHDPSEAFR